MSKELAAILKNSDNVVFFGGAGVSTESGIPDFRSESGLYHAQEVYGHPPEELLSRHLFLRRPELFFRYYRENLIHPQARPNGAHTGLAKLESAGKLKAVVTQNIDGLHQLAGSRTVHELHGSILRNYCMDCAARYPLQYVIAPEKANGHIPLCTVCGGTVRPDVVLYEETLDDEVVSLAAQAIARADTLIVGGTSLIVYPAAGMLRYFHGKTLVLMNRSETSYDSQAHLIIREPIGQAFEETIALMSL